MKLRFVIDVMDNGYLLVCREKGDGGKLLAQEVYPELGTVFERVGDMEKQHEQKQTL